MYDYSGDHAGACRSALGAEQEASLAEIHGWSHVGKQKVHGHWDGLYRRRFAEVCGGLQPSSPQAQDLIAQHYAIAFWFYAPPRPGQHRVDHGRGSVGTA